MDREETMNRDGDGREELGGSWRRDFMDGDGGRGGEKEI